MFNLNTIIMKKTVKKNLIKKNVSNEVVNEFKNLLPSKIEELCNCSNGKYKLNSL